MGHEFVPINIIEALTLPDCVLSEKFFDLS